MPYKSCNLLFYNLNLKGADDSPRIHTIIYIIWLFGLKSLLVFSTSPFSNEKVKFENVDVSQDFQSFVF